MSKTKKIIVIITVISILCCMFIIPVSASTGYVHTMPCSQPQVTENSGYIELLFKLKSGGYMTGLFFWNISTDNSFDDTLVDFDINWYDITITASTSGSNGCFSICYIQEGGYSYFSQELLIEDENGVSRASFYCDYRHYSDVAWIENFHIYGNFNSVSAEPNYNTTFSIVYSETSGIYEALMAIAQSSANSSNSITQNATDNANKIQQNQNDNTDKIIENQQQLQENEKNDAQSSGQGSVDDVSGAIEDKSAGFISAISNLVGSMSYNGTACAWSFPALKLPAIDGVMPEYQLTEEQPIDFEFWVNKIPADILLLVRSLLTIALIVFCFKELYGTISYVLTLKGGGNNE